MCGVQDQGGILKGICTSVLRGTVFVDREGLEKSDGVRGLVFHIIHGSFVDGYGVRTTVFLKGCPLRCLWCCNPEGQLVNQEIKLTTSLCDGCGRCVPACPTDAIKLDYGNVIELDRTLCTNCGKCISACNAGALDRFGWYVTVDELFDIVRKDEQYYRASGGGVTLGGGEPTSQPAFCYEFLRRCRANYIHTAVDTCGYTLNAEGFRVLEEADLLLFDLKGLSPAEHLHSTGVPNEPILANLRRLSEMGKPIIVRMPVIPGHTDSHKNLAGTAELLSSLQSIERVDLLAYHVYGSVKYAQLGRKYGLQDISSITEERMVDICHMFAEYGLNTQIGG